MRRRRQQQLASSWPELTTDDGSTDAVIFNAHGSGANAVSWAPSVLATPAVPKPGQPQQAVTAAKRFVSGGSDNAIRIWGFDEATKKWVEEEEITEHDNWVRDVAWAPNIGLPGMYIASASEVSHHRATLPSVSEAACVSWKLTPGPHSQDPHARVAGLCVAEHRASPRRACQLGPALPRRRVARVLEHCGQHPRSQLRRRQGEPVEGGRRQGLGVCQRLLQLGAVV